METVTIYQACEKIIKDIKDDSQDTSLLTQVFLIAYLARTEKISTFIDISLSKGQSLFSVAYSIYLNKGVSYGVYPDSLKDLEESKISSKLRQKSSELHLKDNYSKNYENILHYKNTCEYSDSIRLLRCDFSQAIQYFKDSKIKPKLLHIDGNQKYTIQYLEYWYDLMPDNSYLVFSKNNCQILSSFYSKIKEKCICIFDSKTLEILYKCSNKKARQNNSKRLAKRLLGIYNRLIFRENRSNKIPTIAIGILTYNHSEFICEALRSVSEQYGNFILKVIIIDDHSTDSTAILTKSFIENECNNTLIQWSLEVNSRRLGMKDNLVKLVEKIKASNCDYFTFCEGDDYYLSSRRLLSLVRESQKNPQAALYYNKVCIYYQEHKKFAIFKPKNRKSATLTSDLIDENYIGNFSSVFISGELLKSVNYSLFNAKICADWIFNLFCSQFGEIIFLDQVLTVYRKHNRGFWNSKSSQEKLKDLLCSIPFYNAVLDYLYENEFEAVLKRLLGKNKMQLNTKEKMTDLLIVDDLFPSNISGFRFEEYTTLLKEIPRSRIYTHGAALPFFEKRTLQELLENYRIRYPELCGKIGGLNPILIERPKLLYTIFLNQAYNVILPLARSLRVPFIFTLYPGGGFGLHNKKSDKKLKKLFNSRWFYSVLVTQDATYKYLIDSNLCPDHKIVFCYGAPVPNISTSDGYIRSQLKPVLERDLNICFVAHKYTNQGNDKGFDVFLKVASKLAKKYDKIMFHVVGPWVPSALGRIDSKKFRFYETQDQTWFDNFYSDKDILLAPGINNAIYKGSFDGFPTGCAIDAALRQVVILSTDPLSLNANRFKENEEIIIIPYDVDEIARKIEFLYHNPTLIEQIGKRGCERVRHIFSYENQLIPRINLIKEAVNSHICADNKLKQPKKISPCSLKRSDKYVELVQKWIFRS